jgi:hypothetical protein
MTTFPSDRRSAFSVWLRTGRWPCATSDAEQIERKYNHWHDPADGRFTFSGMGRHDGSWSAGDFSGGGGGRFGGGGAGGAWQKPAPHAPVLKRPPPKTPPRRPATPKRAAIPSGIIKPDAVRPKKVAPAARVAASPGKARVVGPRGASTPYRRIVRNGYEFHLDRNERVRLIRGELYLSPTPLRSRSAQRRAGGAERQPSDDGGHYVAPRFGGPTDAFNHFPHDAHINRGDYRVLEDHWAKALKQGKRVFVKITPNYAGESIRPFSFDVDYYVNGISERVTFFNKQGNRHHG